MTNNLITREETAALLGVHVRTVRRYAVAGRLTILRDTLTGRVRHRRDEVMALRAQMESTRNS